MENYPSALKFIEEVVALDCHEFKQCPSYRNSLTIFRCKKGLNFGTVIIFFNFKWVIISRLPIGYAN